MATATQLRDRIKVRLSRRTAGSVTNTEVLDALDHAQREILETAPLLPPFLKTSEQITKTGAHSAILNADFTAVPIKLVEAPYGVAYQDTDVTKGFDGKKIKRYDSLEQLDELHSGEGTTPKGYFNNGSLVNPIEIRPYITATQLYYVYFYQQDPTLPSAGDSLWCQHAGDLLMHTAGVEVAQYLRDNAALSYFSQKRQEAHNRFVRWVQAQLDADQEYVMGE